MSEESTKDRSPRAPTFSLEKCIDLASKLHGECRRSAVDAPTAAKAMGYNTVHGGVLTLLGALREYGLIDRPGGKVAVTALAVRIIHPISDKQKDEAIKEAALTPKVFAMLLKDFGDSSEAVLESHLVQSEFKPERAKHVAKAFVANKAFAKLSAESIVDVANEEQNADSQEKGTLPPTDKADTAPLNTNPATDKLLPFKPEIKKDVLAQYTIPLGANQATLVFTGRQLTTDDFDALADFVEFSKKQFVRAMKSTAVTGNRNFPAQAIWKNKDHDMPVTITGVAGEQAGVRYLQSSTGTGIPESELTFV